jgi:transcriptional regulator with XRE-family HTH domain
LGLGDELKLARQAAGLHIAQVAAAGHVSKGHLCNVEKGRLTASPAVIQAYERALGMDRRTLLKLTGAVLGGGVIRRDEVVMARDLYATIAAGDAGPLARVQTTHAVDHAIQRLAVRDSVTIGRLLAWMEGGADAVLRVNAAGILAKTGSPALWDEVAGALARDESVRMLYLKAVRARVGQNPRELARELTNQSDVGARWCATWLLAANGDTEAIIPAMRTESSRETLRAMALAVTGQLHARD